MSLNNATAKIDILHTGIKGEIIYVVFLFVVGTINLTGNALVFHTLLRHGTLRQQCNEFFLSLAISDFGVSVFFITYILGQMEELNFNSLTGSRESCVAVITILQWLEMSSSYHLVAITAVRFIGTVRPLLYNMYVTERRIRIAITAIWIITAGISLLLYTTELDTEVHICRLELVYCQSRIVSLALITVALPITIMTTLYFIIIRIAHKKIHCSAAPFVIEGGTKRNNTLIKEMKSTIMVSLLVGFFALTWTPLLGLMFYTSVCSCMTSHSVSMVFRLVAFTSYGVNVFIYAGRLKLFRKYAKHDLRTCFRIFRKNGVMSLDIYDT